jgi:hypothetical protein
MSGTFANETVIDRRGAGRLQAPRIAKHIRAVAFKSKLDEARDHGTLAARKDVIERAHELSTDHDECDGAIVGLIKRRDTNLSLRKCISSRIEAREQRRCALKGNIAIYTANLGGEIQSQIIDAKISTEKRFQPLQQ